MEIATLIVSGITCLAIIVMNLVKPNIKIKKFTLNFYWLIALLGAIILLSIGSVSLERFWKGLIADNGINPLQILVLFLSMTMISIFLDELGFFAHLASWAIKHAKANQFKIFIIVYILVSVLTMFTSNDIIILTLTPFIIFFCKNGKISPIPFLVGEFMAANTWSMMFIIGNPTNIYLATSFGYDFLSYFSIMWLPTLVAGLVEFGLLILIFYKKLKQPIEPIEQELQKENLTLTIIGLSILGICTVMLIISSYINLPMYLIALGSLILLSVIVLIYSLVKKQGHKEILRTYVRAPWELVPFIISMFVIVLALENTGFIGAISSFLERNLVSVDPVWKYGISSFLTANIINNIPMSVLYTSIINFGRYISSYTAFNNASATFASIIGSNIGAFLTPMGALAGIMWMGILKNHEVKFNFKSFAGYGAIVSIPVLAVSLLMLWVIFSF